MEVNLICRVCLNEKRSNLLSISHKFLDKSGKSILEMIKFCGSIEISEQDELPQRICSECSMKILSACEIKAQCIRSDAVLRERLKKIKTTNDETSFEEVADKRRRSIWPQKCLDCNKIFNNRKEKLSHSKNLFNQCKKSKNKSFKCFICDKNFQQLYKKEHHIREDHPNDGNLTCRICNCVKKTAKSLDMHIKYHFKTPEYCCHFCGKSFDTAVRLKKHLEGFHDTDKKFICDLCGHKVKSKISLKKHLEIKHMNIKNYKCEECGDAYSYTCERVYLQHMYRNHDVEPPIRCPDCKQGFSVQYELKKHKNKFGKCNPPKEYARIIENNRIIWKGAKTIEAAVFSDKKGELFCKFCGKRFTTTSNLMIHNRVKHRGINYKCDLCSNEYTCPKGLQQHKQTKHFNIYPYSCDVCFKKFPQKRPLLRHKIIHTDLKPFECSVCAKKFNDKGSCGRHIKIVHKNLNFTDDGQEIVKSVLNLGAGIIK